MRGQRGIRAVVTGALLAVATACTGSSSGGGQGDAARAAADAYLAAWARDEDAAAAQLTDDPTDAARVLAQTRSALQIGRIDVRRGAVTEDAGRTTAAFDATLTLRGLGDWTYAGSLPVVRTPDGREVVGWSPADVHPRLTPTTRLVRERKLLPRAPIVGRDGRPLMTERPVVTIGVEPRRLTDPKRAYRALRALDVDTARLAKRVDAAKPDALVPVIVLRAADYANARRTLAGVPGIVTRRGVRTLAPTPTYGAALLGSVRPAMKETLAEAGPLASAADEVGTSGLQLTYQQQLAGAPSGKVELAPRSGEGPVETLFTVPGAPGRPLRTTLDDRAQSAAEKALAKVKTPAALVAVRPSTGDVLAAAGSAAGAGYDRALLGRYPPGSTFKVVTTLALLRAGLDPRDTVPCPATITVEGKRFKNYDGLGALGDVPYRRDFTESCNTGVIGAARRLPDDALASAGAALGLGAQWRLGTDAFSGSVPTASGPVDLAASAIGQGRVLASPLAMAMVAAAVADGTPRRPVLLPEVAPAQEPLAALPGGQAATLRALMRATVAGGTAKVLKLPGEPVGAKTGTAEYGGGRSPRTHAWMIGFRGDLAFAVVVENGESGGKTAGPVARALLTALR